MPEEPDEDWLEEALKSPEAYINNDDFSRRVMRTLPRKRRRTLLSRRKVVITASALTGLVSSIPAIPLFTGMPVVRSAIESQWFLTFGMMAILAIVAFSAWWLVEDRV